MGEIDEIAPDDVRRAKDVTTGRRGSLLLVGGVAVVAAGVLVGALTLPGRATTSESASPATSPVAAPVVAAPSPSFTTADGSDDLEVEDEGMPTPTPRPELRPRLAAWEGRVRALLPIVAERLGWTLDADASSVRLAYPGECLMTTAESACESWAFDIDVELVAAAPTRHRWAVRDTWGHMMHTLAGYGECATDGPSGWPEPQRVETAEYGTGRCSRDGNGDLAAYTVGSTSRFESGAGFLAVPAGTDPGISPAGLDEAVSPVMRELTAADEAITGQSLED